MYVLTVATLVGIHAILTLGLNTITGLAGQISLGHAAFFGVGAYTLAVLTVAHAWSFWPAWAAAVVAAGAFGALIGALAIRVREDFLAITTMGVNFVTVAVFLYVPLFGGALGLGGIPPPMLGAEPLGRPGFFLLTLAGVGLALAVNLWLGRSWAGLALLALREDEEAARAAAVDVRAFKILAFTLGTALAGLGGGLYASFLSFISAGDFGFPVSITLLCMLVLGGIGTNRGAVAGAAILGVAPEVFRFLADYRFLTYGALLVLLMRFSPAGLLGDESALWRAVRRRRPAGEVAGAAGRGARVEVRAARAAPGPPARGAAILEVHGLTKRFAGVQALSGVSFTVNAGTILGLFGPNGAGKTTCFHCLSGVLVPDAGRVIFDGRDTTGAAPHRMARAGLGRTFQIVRPFRSLSALENVLVALGHGHYAGPGALARRYRKAGVLDGARALLDRVGLGEVADRPAALLPLGMLKRLEVARALALAPRLLLLDEPLGGLSPEEAAAMARLIASLREEGLTLILVEHHMRLGMALADRVVVLDHGTKIAEGAPAEVRRDPRVIAAYLGQAEGAAGA